MSPRSPQSGGYLADMTPAVTALRYFASYIKYDLRRTPGNHLIFNSNAVHGGLNQRFLNYLFRQRHRAQAAAGAKLHVVLQASLDTHATFCVTLLSFVAAWS